MSVVVWLCLFWAALGLCEESPTVTIAQGRLQGLFLKSRGGRQFSAFLGIPYAAPPVGPFRFHNPVPAKPWEGVRDATAYGSICTQTQYSTRSDPSGSEDCLFINVYTHKTSNDSKTAVLVYIHGGGFIGGCSHLYLPDFFMDNDIILVTLNYRLGPLGFLSMEDKDLSGNYGLKDQIAALRWVKDNIAQFGGDPESITIFGESAGAASVHLVMLSPLSKGLIVRAIAQSGTALAQWAIEAPGQARSLARRLAAELDCDRPSTVDTLLCLREAPSHDIASVSQYLYSWHMDPIILFRPTIEPEDADGAFMTRDPWSLTSDIPWITGITSAEGLIHSYTFSEERIDELNNDFEKICPITLMFEGTAVDPAQTAMAVKQFYFPSGDIKPEHNKNLADMYSDSWLVYPTLEAIRRHRGPNYLYYFDYRGANSFFPDYPHGIAHFEEIQYLFPANHFYGERFNTSTEDTKLSQKLVDMWVNFAVEGKPTKDNSWPEVRHSMEFLSITNDGLVMDKDMLKERDNFWRSLPYRNKDLPKDREDTMERDEL